MKDTVLITKLQDWEMNGKSGITAHYLDSKYKSQTTSLSNAEVAEQVRKANLPALFEVELDVKVTTFNNQTKVKYSFHSAKFLKEHKVF